MKALLRSVIPFVFLMLVASCGMSQEEARQKLNDQNIEYDEETFIDYVGEGDSTVVDLFLKAGMSPSQRALNTALNRQPPHIGVALRLMKEGVKPDSLFERVALINGIKYGNTEMVRLVLETGTDPQFSFERGDKTPLLSAIELGHPRICQTLLEYGADPSARNSDGYTALILATDDTNKMSKEDRHSIVRSLLEAGADPNIELKLRDPDGTFDVVTPLLLAKDSGYEKVAEMLREAGAE